MTRQGGPTNIWGDGPRDQRKFEPGSGQQGTQRRSGERNWWKTLFGAALLAGAGWAAWHFGQPFISKFRSSNDVEECAVRVLHKLPGSVASEAELKAAIQAEIRDGLATPDALAARWYVCYGQRGEDVVVLRDDAFDKSERNFAERLVDEARLRHDVEGVQHNAFTYPLGACYAPVSVDGKPWCVVIGWSEKKGEAQTPGTGR